MKAQKILSEKYKKILRSNYKSLFNYFGPQYWWPGNSVWEILIGAILTQNTAWTNVEKAIANLKKDKSLTYKKFIKLKKQRLADLIKPAGYYNQKAGYLKNLTEYISKKYNGRFNLLFQKNLSLARKELLSIKGIGPETADSMLLYAGGKPIFVVDSYTKRIIKRWGISGFEGYKDIQKLFMENLPESTKLYNEYHALLVALGKNFCKTKPNCTLCPLIEVCKK